MSYKVVDFECECGHVQEYWLKGKDRPDKTDEPCEKCGESADKMKKNLSAGLRHVSWSQWAVS